MTTAREMVQIITTALRTNPVGVVSVTVDGETVTYNRKQAMEELQFWRREAARESGGRPRAANIKLSGI